jgi:SsrA-binding protein
MANKKAAAKDGEQIICVNRQARHNYFIDETFEAGLVLLGSEVKSLRDGKANLKDSYARVQKGEAFLINAYVSPYPGAKEKGLTVIPLKMYFKNGRAKVELGLARGKKLYDKRETLRRKDAEREVERALKSR